MKVVVTGGFGALGAPVVEALRERGVDVVAASRRTGVDLASGKGLSDALRGADAVLHAARHSTRYRVVELGGLRRIAAIAQARRVRPHLVYVSIVGCDRIPFPYFRAKRDGERLLDRSGLPTTTVRATQFHPLVAALARGATRRGRAVAPAGMAFQPCDPAWAAAELVEVLLGPAPEGHHRAADLAGPEVVTLSEAIALTSRADGREPPRVLSLPAVGRTLAAYAAGENLPSAGARIGGIGFTDWLRS